MNAVAKIIQAARAVDSAPPYSPRMAAIHHLRSAFLESEGELTATAEVLAVDTAGTYRRLEVGTPLTDNAVVLRVYEDEGQCFVQTDGDDFACRPRDYRREGPNGPFVMVCDDVVVAR